jgi:hypothetical protein
MGDSLLLTKEERNRFASWLELQASTSAGIIEQMKKLGPHLLPLIEREQNEAWAASIIARKLRATHDESIGKE